MSFVRTAPTKIQGPAVRAPSSGLRQTVPTKIQGPALQPPGGLRQTGPIVTHGAPQSPIHEYDYDWLCHDRLKVPRNDIGGITERTLFDMGDLRSDQQNPLFGRSRLKIRHVKE